MSPLFVYERDLLGFNLLVVDQIGNGREYERGQTRIVENESMTDWRVRVHVAFELAQRSVPGFWASVVATIGRL